MIYFPGTINTISTWLHYHTYIIVSYPEKGGCADPVNEDAILEGVGGRPPGRSRKQDKEDDPFTAQSYQHAQSKLTCIAGRWRVNPL